MIAAFPGTDTVLDYEVSFRTNTDAKLEVTTGDSSKTWEITANKAVTTYGEDDLSRATDSFSFAISNQTKAIYLYSVSSTLLVHDDVDLDLREPITNRSAPSNITRALISRLKRQS